jgi:hypothetical protein
MSNDFLGANFHYFVKLLREKLENPFFSAKIHQFCQIQNLRREFLIIFAFQV